MQHVCLVTGASKGLGRALSVALAKHGYFVLVNYRSNKTEAGETLRLVKQHGDGALAQGDLLNQEDREAIFATIRNQHKRLDVLINLVGDFHFKTMEETTVEDIEAVLCSNLSTMYACCREALPIMRKQKSGKIINFGAAGCEQPVLREKTTPYYLAKTGVLMLTQVMAAEEAKRNSSVTINCISPGVLETSVAFPPGAPVVPLQEVVDAVLRLLDSDQNGQNIEVSRGWKPENQY